MIKSNENEIPSTTEKVPHCGIVMPISTMEDCTKEHWSEVYEIIQSVVKDELQYECYIVSDSADSGFIHDRIVNNLYNCDIVICDVSCKNANVMFELGLRLAFDKATIIIKDDITDYSFDTGIIEHLSYPRDLHFHKINTFKKILKEKILLTLQKSGEEGYSMFLKKFPNVKVAKLEEKTISSDEFLIKSITEIKTQLSSLAVRDSVKKTEKLTSTNMTERLKIQTDTMIKEFCNLNGLDVCQINNSNITELSSYIQDNPKTLIRIPDKEHFSKYILDRAYSLCNEI